MTLASSMLRRAGLLGVSGAVLALAISPAAAAPVGVAPSGAGGSVIAWDASGQTKTHSSLDGKTVIAVAGGVDFSLALTSDGTVISWAQDGSDVPPPSGLHDVTAVAAGSGHSRP